MGKPNPLFSAKIGNSNSITNIQSEEINIIEDIYFDGSFTQFIYPTLIYTDHGIIYFNTSNIISESVTQLQVRGNSYFSTNTVSNELDTITILSGEMVVEGHIGHPIHAVPMANDISISGSGYINSVNCDSSNMTVSLNPRKTNGGSNYLTIDSFNCDYPIVHYELVDEMNYPKLQMTNIDITFITIDIYNNYMNGFEDVLILLASNDDFSTLLKNIDGNPINDGDTITPSGPSLQQFDVVIQTGTLFRSNLYEFKLFPNEIAFPPVITATATATATTTATATAFATAVTLTSTATPSSSVSPSFSLSSTRSLSPSTTLTPSPSTSITPTQSLTPSLSMTQMLSNSPTSSSALIPSSSVSHTVSHSNTGTSTITPTPTSSITRSSTTTSTQSLTPTLSATITSGFTGTLSNSPSRTSEATLTPSTTNTLTRSPTITPSTLNSLSFTPTNTPLIPPSLPASKSPSQSVQIPTSSSTLIRSSSVSNTGSNTGTSTITPISTSITISSTTSLNLMSKSPSVFITQSVTPTSSTSITNTPTITNSPSPSRSTKSLQMDGLPLPPLERAASPSLSFSITSIKSPSNLIYDHPYQYLYVNTKPSSDNIDNLSTLEFITQPCFGNTNATCSGNFQVDLFSSSGSQIIVRNPNYDLIDETYISNINSVVLNIFLEDGSELSGDVKICIEPFNSKNSDKLCLGYLDESSNPPKWKCEDECLDENSNGLFCGNTDHFTNFALLLTGNSNKDKCGSLDWITGSSWGDFILILSLIAFCCIFGFCVVAITGNIPMLRRLLYGSEGMRILGTRQARNSFTVINS